jgi:hypothetical protein
MPSFRDILSGIPQDNDLSSAKLVNTEERGYLPFSEMESFSTHWINLSQISSISSKKQLKEQSPPEGANQSIKSRFLRELKIPLTGLRL